VGASAGQQPPDVLVPAVGELRVVQDEVVPVQVFQGLPEVLQAELLLPTGGQLVPGQPEHLLEERVPQRAPFGQQYRVVQVLALRIQVVDQPHHLPGERQFEGRRQQRHTAHGPGPGIHRKLLVEHEVELDLAGGQAGRLPRQHHAAARHPLVRPDVLGLGAGRVDDRAVSLLLRTALRRRRDVVEHRRGALLLDAPVGGDDDEVEVLRLPRGVPEPVRQQHAAAQHQ
jgi:hypothetical protein